jgi:hypothetical protein
LPSAHSFASCSRVDLLIGHFRHRCAERGDEIGRDELVHANADVDASASVAERNVAVNDGGSPRAGAASRLEAASCFLEGGKCCRVLGERFGFFLVDGGRPSVAGVDDRRDEFGAGLAGGLRDD